MKKLCFLVDSIFTVGGVQRVTAVIAGALSKDYDVTIVTFDSPEKKRRFPCTKRRFSFLSLFQFPKLVL